jgi:antitoxin (DNA-binding transcriptional repressor) of toxin-antitoxin stability system
MWTLFVHMKTATLRDLRNNFSKLESWLAEGETIEICRRGQAIAVLAQPSALKMGKRPPLPDFAAMRKEIWGDRFFSEEEIARINAYELEGQEG